MSLLFPFDKKARGWRPSSWLGFVALILNLCVLWYLRRHPDGGAPMVLTVTSLVLGVSLIGDLMEEREKRR